MALPALPPNVNANELILSAWGNQVVNYLTALPRGQLGYVEMTANSGGVTQTPAASSLNLSVPVAAGRRIRVESFLVMQYAAGTGATHVRAAIYQDGAKIVEAMHYLPGPVSYASLMLSRVVSPAAGTRQFQVYVWTDVGTALIAASATAPAQLTVTDIGVP